MLPRPIEGRVREESLRFSTPLAENERQGIKMKHPVSRELFAYWDELRGARVAPERSELDPAAIRGILADTFVIEVTGAPTGGDRDFPVRLSGTRLNALFLNELKGKSLLSLWRSEYRAALNDVLTCVLDERDAMVIGVQAAPRDHKPVDLEMLLLPLRHHGKTHVRILGSLAPSHVPSWLGLLPVEAMTLTSFRKVEQSFRPGYGSPAGRLLELPGSPVRHGRFGVYEGGR